MEGCDPDPGDELEKLESIVAHYGDDKKIHSFMISISVKRQKNACSPFFCVGGQGGIPNSPWLQSKEKD